MSRHKAYGLSPRDCLKTTLFQKWQRMVAPPGKGKEIGLRKKHNFSKLSDITVFTVNKLEFKLRGYTVV